MVEKKLSEHRYAGKFGEHYSLINTPAEEGYHGAGCGIVEVEKSTDTPVRVHYTPGSHLLRPGDVWAEDEIYICYMAVFSCYTACLF